MKKNTHFKLFASCFAVKGHIESLICDTERGETMAIPNLLFDVLQENKTKSVQELKAHFNHEFDQGIDAFFDKFVQEELGFYTDEPDCFPDIDLSWYSPIKLNNAILEVDRHTSYDITAAVKAIDNIGCIDLQMRFLAPYPIDKLDIILECLETSRVSGLEIFLKYSPKVDQEALLTLIRKHKRIAYLTIHSAPENRIINDLDRQVNWRLRFTTEVLHKNTKEVISPDTFPLTLSIFSEAQHHNSGLNRKVCIDSEGNIKNYLNHSKCFGNIEDSNLEEIIDTPSFQEKWYISNDHISKCQDCQFRYMCVNNADIKQENGAFHKVVDCSFNPYTNTWAETPVEAIKAV